MLKARFLLPIACLALAACTPVDRGFGETVRLNNIRHAVNPEGIEPSPDGPMEAGSGVRGRSAVDRYEKGAVKEPPRESSRTGS